MKVGVKDRLASMWPLIRYDPETFLSEFLFLGKGLHGLKKSGQMIRTLGRHLVYVFGVLFVNKEVVLFGQGMKVFETNDIFVLKNFSGRNVAFHDFAENTIFHHDPLTL